MTSETKMQSDITEDLIVLFPLSEVLAFALARDEVRCMGVADLCTAPTLAAPARGAK